MTNEEYATLFAKSGLTFIRAEEKYVYAYPTSDVAYNDRAPTLKVRRQWKGKWIMELHAPDAPTEGLVGMWIGENAKLETACEYLLERFDSDKEVKSRVLAMRWSDGSVVETEEEELDCAQEFAHEFSALLQRYGLVGTAKISRKRA